MINGAHVVIYTKDAQADRAFFRDLLKFPSVDAGGGWLIFAMPPAEVAFHDSKKNNQHEFFLMCDDIAETFDRSKIEECNGLGCNGTALGKECNIHSSGRSQDGGLRAEAFEARESLRRASSGHKV